MHRQYRVKHVSKRPDRRGVWRSLLRAAPSIIIVGIATFTCIEFHVKFPTASFIFLTIVVLQSLTGGFLSSAVGGASALSKNDPLLLFKTGPLEKQDLTHDFVGARQILKRASSN